MNMTEPIRDPKVIEKMKMELLTTQNYRNYLLFVFLINTGFRISDALKMQVKHVKNKTHIVAKESKTQKERRFYITEQLHNVLEPYIKDKDDDDFLFSSREGENKPISRVQADRILLEAAKKVGLETCSGHTCRKTFGYWHYKKHKNVAILQDIFNHSSPKITKIYIGIAQDDIDETIKDFFL